MAGLGSPESNTHSHVKCRDVVPNTGKEFRFFFSCSLPARKYDMMTAMCKSESFRVVIFHFYIIELENFGHEIRKRKCKKDFSKLGMESGRS